LKKAKCLWDFKRIEKKVRIESECADRGIVIGPHRKIHCIRPDRHNRGDKDPSLQLYPEKNRFYCFGCGIYGGVIEFTRECCLGRGQNISVWDIGKHFSDKYGIAPKSGSELEATESGEFVKLFTLPYRTGLLDKVSSTAEAVYSRLRVEAGPKRVMTSPSQRTLASKIGCSRQMVNKCIKELIDVGLIKKHWNGGTLHYVLVNDTELLAKILGKKEKKICSVNIDYTTRVGIGNE